jgi:phosphoribosylformimino-5-aminoimidazole carboxamide ribotide isomerase
MIVFPAIDLKDGCCVRLVRGEMGSATVFSADPAAQAAAFASAGFRWLHCVDLNGAFEGRSVNAAAIRGIRAAIGIPIQLGGGIRDRAAIEHWLDAGIARVVLGTAALRDPALVREAAKAYPGRVAVGIDARGGRVAVEGWAETSEVSTGELAARFADSGVAAIIFTDIGRDGTGGGVNVEATAALASAVRIPVIASGGVGTLEDLRAIASVSKLEGVIVGRAFYDGGIEPAQALALAETIWREGRGS